MNTKTKVALLFGGRSVEHEISIRSAQNVAAHIDKSLYDFALIGIDKSGKWYLNEGVSPEISRGKLLTLHLNPASPVLQAGNQELQIDVAFPVLHGTDGEDGSIQGLFKAMGIPVVGSGVLGSALSMDKVIAKKVLKESGVPIAPYLCYSKNEKDKISFSDIVKNLGLPFMIKSASLGSSVGVSKVKKESDFLPALEESFVYDDKVIIEAFISGRELECAVIGNTSPRASYPGEIVMIKDYDFYTYTAKYLDEDAIRIDLPAKVEEDVAQKIREISIKAYQALCCEDFARVDLFLTPDGEVVVNEINTIPGFTSASMFPMMWQNMGMSYSGLITELINQCLERHKASKERETHYTVR